MAGAWLRALILLLLFTTSAVAAESKPTYAPLDKEWSADLAEKREAIKDLAEDHSLAIKGDEGDLAVLQQIIDDKWIAKDDTAKFQALGVILGDILVKKLGVSWSLFNDQNYTEPVLKADNADVHIAVMSLLLNRLERGDKVVVKEVYDGLVKQMTEKWKVVTR
jgi:hypothetical protein